MRTTIAILTMLAFLAATGCGSSDTRESPQGGVKPKDEEFSITVPASDTLKQGADKTVTVSLNRGAAFKRDVTLDLESEGISVTPAHVLVRASDQCDVHFTITVARDAAIGEYRVSVKGTPETGESTSTDFTVKVVAQ